MLYDRPRYVAGVSGAPSGPISLVPPRDCDAYIIDKVVTPFDGWGGQAATAEEYDTDEEDARYAADPARRTVQRVLNYVVGWPDEPYARELVPCTRILDYVSPYTLEAFEYALCERQRQWREQPHAGASGEMAETMGRPAAAQKKRGKKGKRAKQEKKRTEKTEKTEKEKPEKSRAELTARQQRDGNGKFLAARPRATPSTTATSTAMPPMSQVAQVRLDAPVVSLGLSPSKQASLSQPVVSLSLPLTSLSSLSPSKQRTAQGQAQTQTTLSLKRPYDKFVDDVATTATATPTETETDSVSVSEEDEEDEEEEEDDDGEEEDELHVSLSRMTPIPLPTVASTSTFKPKATPTSMPIDMRSEVLHKRPKVEVSTEKPGQQDRQEEKAARGEEKKARVTPIPPPAYHTSKPQAAPPEEQDDPEDDPEDDLYEVDRLEGDCYTYVDDDAAILREGQPVPKKLVQYFSVRWKGDWPPDQNPTWEPAENLPPRMVQQYLGSLARQEEMREQSLLASQLGQDRRHQREQLLGLSSDDDDDDDAS